MKDFHAPFNYPGYIASNSLNSPRFISYMVKNTHSYYIQFAENYKESETLQGV